MEIDLYNLEKWSRQWQLLFNAKKCKVMHVGSRNPNREYKLNDMFLDASDHEKDLGVIIDESLKFLTHAAAAIKKANQTLGIIKKSYTSRYAVTISTLYKAWSDPTSYMATLYGDLFLRVTRNQRSMCRGEQRN